MQERLKPLFAALAAAGAASAAHAVTLGDLEVRSALGHRLEARVRVEAAPGERVDASCFSVLPEVPQGLSAIPGLEVTLEPNAAGLRLTSRGAVNEPAAGLALRAACPGSTGDSVREYVLLLDPLPAGASAVIHARRGETLDSLARTLVRESGPRREYLVAMRASNPSLAAVGDREALAEGTQVVLPDLRAAVRGAHAPSPRSTESKPATAPSAAAEMPKPAPARAEKPVPKPAANSTASPAAKPAPVRAEAPAPKAAPKPAPTATAPRARSGDFVLKLSSSQVDLSRSQQVNDAQRQQLRERLLILDQDDQVSALLAMKHSLQQLESRVAELQLKLAAMPASFPERAAPPPAPAAINPPTVEAPPPKVAPPPVKAEAPAPKVEAPPPKVEAPPPKVEAPPPKVEPPPPKVEAPKVEAPKVEAPKVEPPPAEATPEAQAERKSKVVPRPATPGFAAWPEWIWLAAGLLVLLLGWLAMRMRRKPADFVPPITQIRQGPGAEPAATDAALDLPADAERIEPEMSREVDSDAVLATRLPANTNDLQRRYIEERFPEVINGTIVLADVDSVVKGARLFYEDGAMPRAVELLQFAIEDKPREVKTWLALFEIFRLERLSGEYAGLAQRFQYVHGDTDWWRKVRYFGREIDPGNPLFREEPVNTLETIGPREGKRLAANLAHVDPIAENWLQAPMDFENEVLANELRNALMAQAKLADHDLAPNPMPALRNVEMFTVA